MTKKERLGLILDLIENHEIGTQEELTEKLVSMGYNVSQATVSRDINELNLIKGEGREKKSKYIRPATGNNNVSPKIIDIFTHITKSIDHANNLIVIKTISGNGASAGNVVDQMNIAGILGTVAGDDTLLIVARTTPDAERIVKTLRML